MYPFVRTGGLILSIALTCHNEKEKARKKALGELAVHYAFGGRLEFRCRPLTDEQAESFRKNAAAKPSREKLDSIYLHFKSILLKVK
jgi:hypothetical protein